MLFEKWRNKIVVPDGGRGNAPWYHQHQQSLLILMETKVDDGEEYEETASRGCRARRWVEVAPHDHHRWEMFAVTMMATMNHANIHVRTVVRKILVRQRARFSFSQSNRPGTSQTLHYSHSTKKGMTMQASSNALLHDVIKAHKLKKPIMVKIFGPSQCELRLAGKI